MTPHYKLVQRSSGALKFLVVELCGVALQFRFSGQNPVPSFKLVSDSGFSNDHYAFQVYAAFYLAPHAPAEAGRA